jgi:hypothetical protein
MGHGIYKHEPNYSYTSAYTYIHTIRSYTVCIICYSVRLFSCTCRSLTISSNGVSFILYPLSLRYYARGFLRTFITVRVFTAGSSIIPRLLGSSFMSAVALVATILFSFLRGALLNPNNTLNHSIGPHQCASWLSSRETRLRTISALGKTD